MSEAILLLLVVIGMNYGHNKYAKSIDIRNFKDSPYCEEVKVAGSKVKKCLKAVEVPESESCPNFSCFGDKK